MAIARSFPQVDEAGFRRTRRRLAGDSGFTLIELLIVIVIIGALLAFAVPSYLGARDRGAQKAADANVRATLPSVAAFRGDNGNYTGMTASALRTAYDAAVSPTITLSVSGSPPNETYCVGSDVSNKSASFQGPAQASPWYSTDDCTGSALPAAP